jgi:hypothetical protein
MISKFTPGPWTLFNKNGIISIYKNKKEVIKWTGFDSSDYPKDALANATLIAAAPDLFSALINIISWIQLDMIEMQREGHTIKHLAAACDLAQAAINKATGKES